MNTEKQIIAIEEQLASLQRQLGELFSQVYKNNFSSTQTFSKDAIFSSRLRVPVYSAAPTVAEEGDLAYIAGKLYVCTDASPVTFTVVGTQS